MSLDLYPRAIVSDDHGRRGVVKVGALQLDLSRFKEPPRFLRSFFSLFYQPPVQREVRDDAVHTRRDMTAIEEQQAARFLEGLEFTVARAVNDYLGTE